MVICSFCGAFTKPIYRNFTITLFPLPIYRNNLNFLKCNLRYLSSNRIDAEYLKDPEKLKQYFPDHSHEGRTVKRLVDGLIHHNRAALAESITLVESCHPVKKLMGQVLLQVVLTTKSLNRGSKIRKQCLTDAANQNYKEHSPTLRIGITGPPGAGKSTFIESFGIYLVQKVGLRVAVLAIDPSSNRTGGALLGDKTRMSQLSLEHRAYVRPSPARGELGGVARNTTEAMLLCESAGYDVVLIETVGVGQSETVVADMTDVFVLVIPPAGGDELQGLKRGIIENCDVVLVNKADGDLHAAARRIQTEYTSALKFIPRRHDEWYPCVSRMSSVSGDGIERAWRILLRFYDVMVTCGKLEQQRKCQQTVWMWNHIRSSIFQQFKSDAVVRQELPHLVELVERNTITPGIASDVLLNKFLMK